jgi:glyoxylase-like metal-dependent hydrolase (beta-lactamase superfamily II)
VRTPVIATARIELPTPFRIGPVNVYLLEGEPLTLIDTGPAWPQALERLEAGLAEHGKRIEDIELVLLTHQHVDHIGLAAEIQRRGGAQIAALDRLADHLAAYPASSEAEDRFAVEVMHHYSVDEERVQAIYEISKSFHRYAEPVVVDERLTPQAEIVAGGRLLRALVRPGHSPTDTIFVDELDNSAFVGDHLLARVSSNPVIHRPVGPGNLSAADREPTLARYLQSLRQTADLELTLAHPGHGGPALDVRTLIDSRVAHHAERKELIAKLIADGHNTVDALSVALWGDVEASQIYLAVSEIVGHTDLLIAEGRLREDHSGGAVTFTLLEKDGRLQW